MSLEELIRAIDGFDTLKDTDRVSLFSWYLHAHRDVAYVTGAKVNACFDEVHEARPTNAGVLLRNLVRAGRCTRTKDGIKLTRAERDRWARLSGKRNSAVQVDDALNALSGTFESGVQQEFLDEVVSCVRAGANRSACVMIWNLAYDTVCRSILAYHLSAFNQEIPNCFKKSSPASITKRTDFEEWTEFDVVRVAYKAGVLTKNQKRICDERLKRRNMLAHPSSVKATQLQTEEMVLDLVTNVIGPLK